MPLGLNTTTTYYVISDGLSGSTFRLSTTKNGSAITTSGSQSGTHSLVASASLTLNGGTGLATQHKMVVPARSTWSYSIRLSAYSAQNNQGATWNLWGGLRRSLNNIIEIENTQGVSNLMGAFSNGQISVGVDTDDNALDIRVTGIDNQSVRWCAVVDICQVSFGTP